MSKAEFTLQGRTYSVACALGQEDRLVSLARALDRRVTEIKKAAGDLSMDRLLMIAALALLDELDVTEGKLEHVLERLSPTLSRPDDGPQGTDTLPQKTQEMARVLEDAAARIEALVGRLQSH